MVFPRIACRHFATNATPSSTAVIPKLGRHVSRIGFGAYRITPGEPRHAQALRDALKAGVSIIDTASNFANGGSERAIGETLEDMAQKEQLDRQSLTLVSKAGYLTADQLDGFEPGKDYVQINDKSFHTVSPKILEREITSSLERLKTNKLDIFLINGPERMLMAKNRSYTPAHLYQDLKESFQFLDSQVANGTIGGYGVCSNTMALPAAADHVSLKDVLNACIKPENFVAIEAPVNLFEREVVFGDQKTVSDIAKENDIYLMTNRPLNAIANGQIRVLVNHIFGEGQSSEHQLMEKMTQTFSQVSNLESDMMSELPLEEETLASKFVWGQVLSENLARLAVNHFATKHYLTQQVLPAIDKDLKTLEEYASQFDDEKAESFNDWMSSYKQNVRNLADDIVSYAYIDTLRKNSELDRILDALSPTLSRQVNQDIHSPLTVKALRVLLGHDQIGTVFTGMRDPVYVNDALLALDKSIKEPLSQQDINDIWQCPIFQ
ncbi:aldo keto reductase family protein [Lichtheimia corymbifera JMRC:FSU:9682]|uniref:Aldo keto reductase family protein n=1 Tax=Lichtheimia corymbifera JMRC:FSU:9682 TaxID=1263082 RepID=A0A068S2R4_9FUNG|nr:aldo keto reductase family protein [Lichtheimia corymbifera JMRC:FSU:9682]